MIFGGYLEACSIQAPSASQTRRFTWQGTQPEPAPGEQEALEIRGSKTAA